MNLELLFLGSGTSAGVPMIGCDCSVCTSSDPRDNRTRASVLVSYPQEQPPVSTGAGQPTWDAAEAPSVQRRSLLIDTTPEMRIQMLRHRIHRIDGVLFTHSHADHIFGMDDLRRFNAVMKTPIDLYAERSVIEQFGQMFRYIFEPQHNVNASFVPHLLLNAIEPGRPFDLFGATWTPLRLLHGRLPILGFRVDWQGRSLAYCTDVSAIPPETYPLMADLDVLVIDALRYRHHPTHFTVDQALEQIEHIQPRRAYFTHIAHEIRHAELEPQLPEHIRLAYDGLVVELEPQPG